MQVDRLQSCNNRQNKAKSCKNLQDFNGADGRIRTGDLILTKDTGTCGPGGISLTIIHNFDSKTIWTLFCFQRTSFCFCTAFHRFIFELILRRIVYHPLLNTRNLNLPEFII